MERRKTPRIPYGAWIEDLTKEAGIQFYLARDLSLGGLLLLAANPPEVGHTVHLRLIVENESRVMALDGRVIRHSPAENSMISFAIRFMNLDLARQAFLEDLVKECSKGMGEDDGLSLTAEPADETSWPPVATPAGSVAAQKVEAPDSDDVHISIESIDDDFEKS
jgi:hypothetical protein